MTEYNKSKKNFNSTMRIGHVSARKQCIERWATKRQSASNHGAATAASTLLGTVAAQKRSESSFLQTNRMLTVRLLQLSEERQVIIERRTFDQKLFANRQALKHKDNPIVLDTLSYVRKCCKYANTHDVAKDYTKPTVGPSKRSHSRSSSSARSPPVKRSPSANTYVSPVEMPSPSSNEKPIHSDDALSPNAELTESKTIDETATQSKPSDLPTDDDDDDAQKRHVQFQLNTDSTNLINESVHPVSKPDSPCEDQSTRRHVTSAPTLRSSSSSQQTRSTNSAPSLRTVSFIVDSSPERVKPSLKSKQSISPMGSLKTSIRQFRLHPERFLSASNVYLPLLRRQAIETGTKEFSTKQKNEKSSPFRKQQAHMSPPLSHQSTEPDVSTDNTKSFLSEDNDIGKSAAHSQLSYSTEQDRKMIRKRVPTRIDLMETGTNDSTSHTMAMARLRDREYARLNELVHSNLIEKIIEPFSTIKTDENEPSELKQDKLSTYSKRHLRTTTTDQSLKPVRARQLADILRSIDSLTCAETLEKHTRKDIDMEKNRAKLGILIF